MKRTKNEILQIGVRLPEGLRANIERAAKKRGVSMNREFVDRVERSFELSSWLGEALEALHGTDMAVGLMRGYRAGFVTFDDQVKSKMRAWFEAKLEALPKERVKK